MEAILDGIEREPSKNPLYFTPNLVLLSCELYELSQMLESQYSFLVVYTEKLRSTVSDITAKFVTGIEEEERLRFLCFEKDFEGRDALTLLSNLEIVDIMNNKNMERVALELWTSEFDTKGSILECSSAWKMITYDSLAKPRDIVQDSIFYNFANRTN